MNNVNTEQEFIEVSGISIEIVKKEIKNLHLRVYPPDGRVRVSAPLRMEDDAIRVAISSRLAWIKKYQAHFVQQRRQSQREMVTGESHYFQGKRYRLNVIEHNAPPEVNIVNNTTLDLRVRPGTDAGKRRQVLETWYRQHLWEKLPEFIEIWQPIIGVRINESRIKKMKTRWGSCNIQARRIWINLELAKRPLSCLEYVIVHEMVHLFERHHNERFKAFMDQFIPDWQLRRDELNSSPLTHEYSSY